MKPIIAVIGGSTCTTEQTAIAEETGRLLAQRGAIVVCGGLRGVVEAAAKGGKASGGVTVGILPGADAAAANPYIDVPLATGLGEMRNFLIVRTAHALIAIGGGVGTLSEIALARRIGKPVVGLHDSFRNAVDIPRGQKAVEAVQWALARAREGVVSYAHASRHEIRTWCGADRRLRRLSHGGRDQADGTVFPHPQRAGAARLRGPLVL